MARNSSLSFRLGAGLFLKPLYSRKKPVIFLLLALLVLALSQSLILFCLGPFLKVLLGPGLSQEQVLLSDLLPEKLMSLLNLSSGLALDSGLLIWLVPGGLLVAGALRSVSLYVYQFNTAVIALFITKNYRDRFFEALLGRQYLYIRTRSPAEWMSALMNDVLFLQARFTDILNSFIRDGVVMVSALASLYIIYWPLAVILTGIAPFIAFGMGRTGKRIAYFAEAFQKELASMAGHILEIRQRFDFIRAQQGEAKEARRWGLLNSAYYLMIRKSLFIRAAFAPVMEWLGFTVFAIIIVIFSGEHAGEQFTGDKLVILLAALGILLRPLRNIGEQMARFQETRGSLQRSLNVFQETAAEQSDISACDPKPLLKEKPVSEDWTLEISDLQSGYEAGRSAVKASNVSLQSGKSIALVGPSGSGKSTLLKTLAGLINPTVWKASGDHKEWSRKSSMVGQEPFLFEDSLRNNLIYGLPSELSPTRADLDAALAKSHMTSEVAELKGGVNHQIQAVQRNLSGGQIQRLVIARALLRPADLILFDEATSAIDSKTEQALLSALIKDCKKDKKGFLAITHRLQCLSEFDEIWFFEHGSLIAKGTHQQLMSTKRYREFYGSSQVDISAGSQST